MCGVPSALAAAHAARRGAARAGAGARAAGGRGVNNFWRFHATYRDPGRRARALAAHRAGSTGCSNFRDLFSAHADVAAEAGGQELSAERLAEILALRAKACTSTARPRSSWRTSGWTTRCFGQAVARGELPTDSASITEVVWPEISEMKGMRWHDTLMAAGAVLRSAVDSVYGDRRARPPAHPLRGRAQRHRRTARRRQEGGSGAGEDRGGTNFSTLAASFQDAGARPTAATCRRARRDASCPPSTARRGHSSRAG